MTWLKSLSLLFALAAFTEAEWYENANFYQIYPRSFMDSDGDGVGDLQGIKSKLSYLKDLGIDGVWLSPIYKSPMADFGYDISDFRNIHDEFGSLEDFQQLADECHKLGLKLILDFVPNHSSDEHEWFKKSEKREPGFEDFYIWRDPKIDEISNIKVPPTNWNSNFRYSAWKWSNIRNQMYYHMFHYKQPDLNYRNPKVVQEMKNVISYWMEKGVDGFRIDAVNSLFEKMNSDGSISDEPRSYDPNCDRDDFCYFNHIYTLDQFDTYDMVFQWRKLVDDFSSSKKIEPKVLMTETYAKLDLMLQYYGNATAKGSHIPFNFELISRVNINSTAKDYKDAIESWLFKMPPGQMANWVLGNHDQHRLASRLGEARGDLLNILLQTLPGVAITYQGEELVMTNVHLTWEETVDPPACNSNPEIYHERSRDPARTPFPWDNTKNAGFSTADKTWLPVGNNYLTVNVKAQEEAANSHLKIFKKLTKIRKEPIFMKGNYAGALSNNDNVFVYKRQLEDQFAVVVLNFHNTNQTVNLTSIFPMITNDMKIYTSSLDSGLVDGASINPSAVHLKANHGVVLLSGVTSLKSSIFLIIAAVIFVLRQSKQTIQ